MDSSDFTTHAVEVEGQIACLYPAFVRVNVEPWP